MNAQAVLKGRVRAVQSLAPLANAEVLIEDLAKVATTNDSGHFRITGIPLGVHQFRVRRIGFQGAVASLRVEAADSVILDLTLEAWVPELEPMFVVAKRHVTPQMQLFEERRRIGLGRYLTSADLRENEHRRLDEVLRDRGVDTVYDPSSHKAYSIGRASPTFEYPSTRCTMRLFIDGAPVTDPDLLRIPMQMIEAVEVYKFAAAVPIEYSATSMPRAPPIFGLPDTSASCGVVLIWSRI